MPLLETLVHKSMRTNPILSLALALFAAAGCSSHDATTGPTNTGSTSFTVNPCSISGTLQLSAAEKAVADCSNGGTTVTLAGNGASYLIVSQFATSLVPNSFVPYHVSSGNVVSASRVLRAPGIFASRAANGTTATGSPLQRPRAKQLAFDHMLRARARQQITSGRWSASMSRTLSPGKAQAAVSATVAPDSLRDFQVLSNANGSATTKVSAALVYAGSDVLIYVDTLAPANGFTASQLQAFGQLFDQTLYPIDVAAFGPPTDIDQNGHVIMLMTPVVNALVTATECKNQGYIAGFFSEDDLGGGPTDPFSNNGEIFYSIVPDPNGTKSCAHSVDDVDFSVPATFMHELQHLISFSQHVVVHGGNSEYGWLDEGLSIVAEELGSLHYEQECPGTACRTDPTQIFPDSSQGFVSGFLYDSYQYALLPTPRA